MTARCPLSYDPLAPGEELYSAAGLRSLSPRLGSLAPLEYSSDELMREAAARSVKMSIGGVQPKVSAVLRIAEGRFDLVTTGGRYILKPENPQYPEIPANEDLTMRLARAAGLSTPLHGMLYGRDGRLCFFVRRFDRTGRAERLAVEDFAQLLGLDRDSKYASSMERVATVLDRYCTFPVVEKADLLRRTLVCFLTGNEDMHLKNFSIVTGADGIRRLSPCYDFVNTTIVLHNPTEELALPLDGKRSNLQREHFLEYFGRERLGLSGRAVEDVVESVRKAQTAWDDLIGRSFLSDGRRDGYREVLAQRRARLGLVT